MRLPAACAAVLCWAAACGAPAGPSATTSITHAEPDGPDSAATESSTAGGRPPTMQERLVIERLARIAERVRKLPFRERVRVEVHDREAIVAHLTSEIEEDDVTKAEVVYTALGLLPEDIDVRVLLERVLGEQVVGYYDHEQDRLVIRDDVMRALGRGLRRGAVDEARVTIVHELVHALQDQRLSLGEDFDDDDRDSDPESAYHAVVEGDATLAMIAYLAEAAGGRIEHLTQNPATLRTMMSRAQALMGQQELSSAPAILRVTLLSSYVDGLLFVAALHARGGWAAVDGAHRSPPASTEVVLHPERYLRGELPDDVRIPAIDALADAGLEIYDADTLGELEMKVYFGQRDDSVDEVAAAGWNGDRLHVYRRAGADGAPAGRAAVVWFTTWDDAREAIEAEAAALRVVELVPADRRAGHLVAREGRAVLIVRELEPTLHAPVRDAFTAFARALPAGPATSGSAP